jgi:hypothetical protein
MNRSVISIDGPAQHDAVQRLLPWYLNQTLSAAERVRVDRHLLGCALCRSDLLEQRELVALVGPVAASGSVDRDFAALARVLDPSDRAADAAGRFRSGLGRRDWGPTWMRAALAAQFTLILGLGVSLGLVLFPRVELTAPYRTLGAPLPARDAGDQVIIAFRDDVNMASVRRILERLGARVVDGPTATGAFVIAVPGGTAGQVIANLRKIAEVRLAESLVLTRSP